MKIKQQENVEHEDVQGSTQEDSQERMDINPVLTTSLRQKKKLSDKS